MHEHKPISAHYLLPYLPDSQIAITPDVDEEKEFGRGHFFNDHIIYLLSRAVVANSLTEQELVTVIREYIVALGISSTQGWFSIQNKNILLRIPEDVTNNVYVDEEKKDKGSTVSIKSGSSVTFGKVTYQVVLSPDNKSIFLHYKSIAFEPLDTELRFPKGSVVITRDHFQKHIDEASILASEFGISEIVCQIEWNESLGEYCLLNYSRNLWIDGKRVEKIDSTAIELMQDIKKREEVLNMHRITLRVGAMVRFGKKLFKFIPVQGGDFFRLQPTKK